MRWGRGGEDKRDPELELGSWGVGELESWGAQPDNQARSRAAFFGSCCGWSQKSSALLDLLVPLACFAHLTHHEAFQATSTPFLSVI